MTGKLLLVGHDDLLPSEDDLLSREEYEKLRQLHKDYLRRRRQRQEGKGDKGDPVVSREPLGDFCQGCTGERGCWCMTVRYPNDPLATPEFPLRVEKE